MTGPDPDGLVGTTALRRSDRSVIRDARGELGGEDFRQIAAEMDRWSATWSPTSRGGRYDLGLIAPQSGESLAAFTGLALAGWSVGVLDPSWTASEQQAALGQLDPVAVVVPAHEDAIGGCLVSAGWRPVMHPGGAWIALLAPGSADSRSLDRPGSDTDFYVGFTSGSTGTPKAFARTHRSWWESFRGLDALVDITPDQVVSVPGALSGSHFLYGAVHALHRDADIDLRPIPRNRSWAGESAPDVMYVVPSLLARMVDAAPLRENPPRHLMCAGARLDPATVDRVATVWPDAGIVEYYGTSELSFVSIRCPGDGAPSGSVGRAFPGVEITIRDERDRVVPAGVHGRVFARSPLVFSGYRGTVPQSAARCADDGAWSAGDMGHLDENGYLYVAGRGSELIISGGLNVQPEDVEGAVAPADGVAEVVVVGVPDDRWGEVVVAVIAPEKGATLTRAALRETVATLSTAKRPRRYLVHPDPFPLLRSQKIDRVAVRDKVMAGILEEIR